MLTSIVLHLPSAQLCYTLIIPVLGILLSIRGENVLEPLLPLCASSPTPTSGRGVVVVGVVGGGLVLLVISLERLLKASHTSKSPSKSDGFTPSRSGFVRPVTT